MAFHLSGFGGKQNTVSDGGTAGTAASGASSAQLHGDRTARELQDLKPGQTMSGEVIAKNGSEVQIQIDENTVLTARLEKDIQLALGQRTTFEVKSNTKEQLALRPLFENLAQDANGTRALRAAALPVTARTLSMVSALMEQGMGIDRQTLQSVFKDVAANTGGNPVDVVALHKLQLPVNAENLAQIAGYRNFEHSMLKGIETIADHMTQTLLDMVDGQGGAQSAAALLRGILDVFSGAMEGGGMTAAAGPAPTGGETLTDGAAGQTMGADGMGLTEPTAAFWQDGTAGGTGFTGAEPSARPDGAQNMQTAVQAGGALPGAAAEVLTQAIAILRPGDGAEEPFLLRQDGMPPLPAEERAAFAAQLEAAGVPQEIAAQAQSGSLTAQQLLTELSWALASGGADTRAMRALLSGRGMKLLLQTQIENNWLLPPDKAAYKQEIEQLYRRLGEQSSGLAKLLAGASQEHTGLAKSVRNVQESVEFIQQLNQNFTYVQLPLKMMTQNAHGDLYVYTNKKNLAKQDGSVSALLHLDMEHLGSMDIYVSMQQQKVSTKFYLQREEILDFLEANMDILNERLLKRGYTMQSEVLYRKEKANVASEMLKQEGETNMISMFSFDVRA